MTIKSDIDENIRTCLAEAWPDATLASPPTPLTGGFWATMFRLHLDHQPPGIPADVVFRIAPDAPMGAKELAVQRNVADQGFATPKVRLSGRDDGKLGGRWSITDFAPGASPLGNLSGLAALRHAPALVRNLPRQLAGAMASLHALDPEPVSAAVRAAAPGVAWTVQDLLEHFEVAAAGLGRPDLVTSVQALTDARPPEGRTVVCHGDLHPFNLLIDEAGNVTVIDWTAAMRTEPAFDVAFTTLLLANPPLVARGPIGALVDWVGTQLERRFVARYRELAPGSGLGSLDWYRGLHGMRILVELASLRAHHDGPINHPFVTLEPAATAAVRAVIEPSHPRHRSGGDRELLSG